jgi:hypothetical protein
VTPPGLVPVWTAPELAATLREAFDAVDLLDPPDDLRVPAFNVMANGLLQLMVDPKRSSIALGQLRGLPARG